jgi:hypothetical protein
MEDDPTFNIRAVTADCCWNPESGQVYRIPITPLSNEDVGLLAETRKEDEKLKFYSIIQ